MLTLPSKHPQILDSKTPLTSGELESELELKLELELELHYEVTEQA
jgi:hypothetical protein